MGSDFGLRSSASIPLVELPVKLPTVPEVKNDDIRILRDIEQPLAIVLLVLKGVRRVDPHDKAYRMHSQNPKPYDSHSFILS